MPQVTVTPISYSQLPVKPAHRKPVVTGRQPGAQAAGAAERHGDETLVNLPVTGASRFRRRWLSSSTTREKAMAK